MNTAFFTIPPEDAESIISFEITARPTPRKDAAMSSARSSRILGIYGFEYLISQVRYFD
jgi:hypothetical protein